MCVCGGGGDRGEGEREMGGEQARTVEVGGSNSKKTEQSKLLILNCESLPPRPKHYRNLFTRHSFTKF